MRIESCCRNNSDISLLQRDKTAKIYFVRRSPDNNTIIKTRTNQTILKSFKHRAELCDTLGCIWICFVKKYKKLLQHMKGIPCLEVVPNTALEHTFFSL